MSAVPESGRPWGEVPAPLHPRLYAAETSTSFVRRYEDMLDVPTGYAARLARYMGMSEAQFAELECALPDLVMIDHARYVDLITGRRFACTDCTGGDVVELEPHFDSYTCRTHGRALFPRLTVPEPGEESPVATSDVLDADERLRAMHAHGLVSPGLLAQAAWVLAAPGAYVRGASRLTATSFPTVVDLLELLTDMTFLRAFTSVGTSRERRAVVRDGVATQVREANSLTVARVLYLLDQASAMIRNHPEHVDPAAPRVDLFDAGAVYRAGEPSGHTLAPASARGRTRAIQPADDSDRSHARIRREASVHPTAGADNAPRHPTRYRARLAAGSLAMARPDLAAQWVSDRNDGVTPEEVTSSGNYQKFWWQCPNCGHQWQATPNNRAKGRGCPACSNRVAGKVNNLAVKRPDIARWWDYDANGTRMPEDVVPGTTKLIAWVCPRGHHFVATAWAMTHGHGCAVCRGRAVRPGENDLATTRPDLAAMWDLELNGTLTPEDVTERSGVRAFWVCAHGHRWCMHVATCAKPGRGCPVCNPELPRTRRPRQRVPVGHGPALANSLAVTHPDIAKFWARGTDEPAPTHLSAGSNVVLTWSCTNGLPHTFPRRVCKRVQNSNCSVCTGHRLLTGFNDLKSRYPALARDWDTTANGTSPDLVLPGNCKRWWKCRNGHATHDTVPNRLITHGCTRCPPDERAMNTWRLPPHKHRKSGDNERSN